MGSKNKRLFYKVFHYFFTTSSGVHVFGHFYQVRAFVIPKNYTVENGAGLQVFQFVNTKKEAAARLETMCKYLAGSAYRSLPSSPAFNDGQGLLF